MFPTSLCYPVAVQQGVGITLLQLGSQPVFADNVGSCQGKLAV